MRNNESSFPNDLSFDMRKVRDIDYGSNPGQKAAFYRLPANSSGLPECEQLYGQPASFNNLRELGLTRRFLDGYEDRAAMVVAKHGIPAGFAFAPTIEEAREKATQCDLEANLGGVEVYTQRLTAKVAAAIKTNADAGDIRDVIAAPSYEAGALDILKTCRKGKGVGRMRVFKTGMLSDFKYDVRFVDGGVLVEELPDYSKKLTMDDVEVVSKRQPTEEEKIKLLAEWEVARKIPSNAVVVGDGRVKDGKLEAFWTYGIGTSTKRNRAVKMAVENADDQSMLTRFGLPCTFRSNGAVAASDGFFPRVDGIDALGYHGVKAVITGEGGIHAPEVIEAGDKWEMALLFSRLRAFSH